MGIMGWIIPYSQIHMLKLEPLEIQNVTALGNRAFQEGTEINKEVIKVK